MGTRHGRSKRHGRRLPRYWWLAVLPVLVVLAVLLAWRAQAPPRVAGTGAVSGTVVQAVVRRETRPTLDPALFTGKAALAYQVAREIPDVLDRLHCYCGCGRSAGHVSLLSCYTDGHAAG